MNSHIVLIVLSLAVFICSIAAAPSVSISYAGEAMVENGVTIPPANANPGFHSAASGKRLVVLNNEASSVSYTIDVTIADTQVLKPAVLTGSDGGLYPLSGTWEAGASSEIILTTECDDAQDDVFQTSRVDVAISFAGDTPIFFVFTQSCGNPTGQPKNDFFIELVDTTDLIIQAADVTEEFSNKKKPSKLTALTTDDTVVLRWGIGEPYQVSWFNLTSSSTKVVDPTTDLEYPQDVQNPPFVGRVDSAQLGNEFVVSQPCLDDGQAKVQIDIQIEGFAEVFHAYYQRDCGSAQTLIASIFLSVVVGIVALVF